MFDTEDTDVTITRLSFSFNIPFVLVQQVEFAYLFDVENSIMRKRSTQYLNRCVASNKLAVRSGRK